MVSKTQDKSIIDLMDLKTLMILFRGYVDKCIDEYVNDRSERPKSFDEWYNLEYLPDIEGMTKVITLRLISEGASGGHLCGGSEPVDYKVRIPAEIIADNGAIVNSEALQKFGKKLTQKVSCRLPRCCTVATGFTSGRWTDHWILTNPVTLRVTGLVLKKGMNMDVLNFRLNGKRASLSMQPHLAFRVLKFLMREGNEVEVEENGQWKKLEDKGK